MSAYKEENELLGNCTLIIFIFMFDILFVCVPLCMQAWRPEDGMGAFFNHSLTEPKHTVLRDPPVSTSPSSGLQMCTTVPSFYMDAEDLNSGPEFISRAPKSDTL